VTVITASAVAALSPEALNLSAAAGVDTFKLRDVYFIQDNANTVAHILNASNVIYYEASIAEVHSNRTLDVVSGHGVSWSLSLFNGGFNLCLALP
jgi:hypothetical protein